MADEERRDPFELGLPSLGTPVQAIQYALQMAENGDDRAALLFLRDWSEGDLSDWPHFRGLVRAS